jgi:hypothetical protein
MQYVCFMHHFRTTLSESQPSPRFLSSLSSSVIPFIFFFSYEFGWRVTRPIHSASELTAWKMLTLEKDYRILGDSAVGVATGYGMDDRRVGV